MKARTLIDLFQFGWSLYANSQQMLAWEDAAQARIARDRAEAQAVAQLHAMLNANPGGQLGNAKLNDRETLKRSGLL